MVAIAALVFWQKLVPPLRIVDVPFALVLIVAGAAIAVFS